jgi:hypothetical protein
MSSTSSTKNDVTKLSWDTILSYNKKNAFAVDKDSLEDLSLTKYKTINTKSYKESIGLLSNLSSKLDTLKSNLTLMQQYAEKGAKATISNTKVRQTSFAQMRSLSAGIDSVVRSLKLDGTTLFTGRTYNLSYGSGKMQLNLDNLLSSDEDGLNLAKSTETGNVTYKYDLLATLKNASVDIDGLDIKSVSAVEADELKGQLKDGDYWLKVSYAGEKSTVEIQKMDGTTIEKVSDVDLSGGGLTSVKFRSGVAVSFDKTYVKTALGNDKADYDADNPVSLYANLTYSSVVGHQLNDGTGNEVDYDNHVSVTSGSRLKGSTGMIKVTADTTTGGSTTLKSGQYDMKIKYNGTKSSVWLYNSAGTLVGAKQGIDLTSDKAVTVDLNNGMSVKLDPTKDFSSDKRDYHTYINFTAAESPSDELDFDAYSEQIAAALEVVQEQIDAVTQAQDTIKSAYSTIQSALKAGSSTTSASYAQSLLNGTSAGGLFGTINTSSGMSSSSATTSVLTASGNILGALSGSVSTLKDVDSSILAKYYR